MGRRGEALCIHLTYEQACRVVGQPIAAKRGGGRALRPDCVPENAVSRMFVRLRMRSVAERSDQPHATAALTSAVARVR
jgi:hypothetical protein